MLHTPFSSDLPYFDAGCYKQIWTDETGLLRRWSKITEIETGDDGNIIRVRVITLTLVKTKKTASGYKFKHEAKDYVHRSWITKVMREFAHIAAKNYMRRMF